VTGDCRAFRLQLAAYADDELGVDAAIEVERHLFGCGACRRATGRQRHLARALRELHPAAPTPPDLEARVRHALFGPTAVRRAAIAGVLVIAVGAGLAGWRTIGVLRAPGHDARPASEPLRAAARAAEPAPDVAAAAALHRQADDGALALELTSGEVAVVNAWLRTRLPFAGTIGAPGRGASGAPGTDASGAPGRGASGAAAARGGAGADAITLVGATPVMLGTHPAGLVRYRLGGRTISLFLLAEPVWSEGAAPVRVGSVDFRVFQRRGLDLIGWSHASISYLLVSEDGLTTGDACAACHGSEARGAIAEFVAAVAGPAHGAAADADAL
jgi:hypothetical protein